MSLKRSSAWFSAAFVGAVGCTFGGLDDYEIQSCDPGLPQSQDPCNRLSSSADTCMPFQCDAATRHCVQRTRDDDRDGDPPMRCGGTDCDDANPAKSGKAPEICDGADNDCDGLVDEDALVAGAERTIAPTGALTSSSDPILAPSDDAHRNGLAAFISGTCVPFVSLEPGGGGAVSGASGSCTVSDPNSAPRQPYPLVRANGPAAVFAATSTCPAGRFSYRAISNPVATLDFACDSAHPVALPAVAAMPSTANANSGLAAWYEVAVGDRDDPVGSCTSAKPATLAVLPIDVLASPTVTAANVLRTTELATSTRPPALLPVEQASGMLLASPLGADVGVWLVKSATTTLPAATRVPLANARAVALASRLDGTTVRVAIAAEIGCRPTASISVAFGTIDAAGALAFDPPIEVAPAAEIATNASIAWEPTLSEWWVAWIDSVPHAHLRRLSPSGTPIGGALDLGKTLPTVLVSGGQSVFALDPAANGGSFVEIPIGCAKL
jgi:hypothetical protein